MYTRTRTKGTKIAATQPANGYHQAFSGYQSPFSLGTSYQQVWNGGPYVTTSDVEIQNFHERRANGETFFNPFETTRETRVLYDAPWTSRRVEGLFSGESTGSWSLSYYPSTILFRGSAMAKAYGTTVDPLGPDLTAISASLAAHAALRDAASNAALADIAKTDALLLVSLAEFHQTVNMLGKYAFALNSRFAGLRDLAYNFWRNPKGMSREAGTSLAAEYLSLRYGVMPLVYDIQGVVNAMLSSGKGQRQTARGRQTFTDSKTHDYTSPASTIYPAWSQSSSTTIVGEFKAGFLYEPVLDSLETRLGLHPSVLPEVFFELTKLSFVADWFFDLSETIRALSADVHGKIIGGWLTEEVSSETVHANFPGSQSTYYTTVNSVQKTTHFAWDNQPNVARAYAFITTKKRTPLGVPSVKMPTLRVRLNSLRVADALALVATTLAGTSAGFSRSIRL